MAEQNADKYQKGGPQLRRFLQESQGLYRGLDMHHRIVSPSPLSSLYKTRILSASCLPRSES